MGLEIKLKVRFSKNLENGPLELKLRVGKIQLASERRSSTETVVTSEHQLQAREKTGFDPR